MLKQTRDFATGIFTLQRGEMSAACMLDLDLCYDKLDAGDSCSNEDGKLTIGARIRCTLHVWPLSGQENDPLQLERSCLWRAALNIGHFKNIRYD
jgi:hypothetical protein